MLAVVILFPSVSAIGGGGATDHMDNPTPWCGEDDVSITIKGVQTCVDVTLNTNCTVNLTFQWLNLTTWTWLTYGEYTGVNTTGQYCFWNDNVSCSTENDWMSWWHDWRVIANFTCYGNYTYTEVFYCYFCPERCALFYIYPPNNNSGLCPCCIPLCAGVNNTQGNLMNITFWSNLSMGYWDYFYLGVDTVTFAYVPNGTYCFNVPNFILYNYTYFWYVNVTDTITGEYEVSNIYDFTTAESIEDCDCGEGSGGLMIIREYNLVLFLLILCVALVASLLTYRKYR